jgi:hypothetical protein
MGDLEKKGAQNGHVFAPSATRQDGVISRAQLHALGLILPTHIPIKESPI